LEIDMPRTAIAQGYSLESTSMFCHDEEAAP